jgi:DNA modification methylase
MMADAPALRDRILDLRRVRAADIDGAPWNWRRHPAAQVEALAASIEELGFFDPLDTRLTAGGRLQLIDGHARRDLLSERIGPDTLIPCVVTDFTEEEARKANLLKDPLAAMATADAMSLHDLLTSVGSDSPALAKMFDDLKSQFPLPTADTDDPSGGGDGFDTTPEEGPTRTALGQLWLIGGRHRLLVGDCTLPENVDRLLRDSRIELVWTDPPYGVSIGQKNRFLNSIAPSNRIEEDLCNDSLDEVALSGMLCAAFDNVAGHCTPGASWYVAAPAGPLHVIFGTVLKDRGILRQMIVWVKNNATFSPMGNSYHWRHEPILYGWLPDGAHRYHGDRKQDTVWEIDRPQASPDHPTTKPLELVARAVRHSSLPDQIVCDPFLGSGTTLIAAHRLNRTCYGCELDPKYADVILKRAESEGLSTELIENDP